MRRHAGPVHRRAGARKSRRRLRRVAGSGRPASGSGPAAHGLEHGQRPCGEQAAGRDRAGRAILFGAFLRGAVLAGACCSRRSRPGGPAASLDSAGPAVHRGDRGRAAVRDPVPPGEVRRRRRRAAGELAGADQVTRALTLLPAVDVAAGQAVRLVQGEAGTETAYGDPLQAALGWQRAGAEGIHLVDLDAAFGRGSNADLLAEVGRKLDVAVELSGGIRDDVALAAVLRPGAQRGILGPAALHAPDVALAAL